MQHAARENSSSNFSLPPWTTILLPVVLVVESVAPAHAKALYLVVGTRENTCSYEYLVYALRY